MDVATIQKRIFSGSLVGFLRIGLAIPVYLALTPLILNVLGEERFGLWSFSTTIIGLINLADFGLKNSLVYHVANQRHDEQAIIGHFSVTVIAYLFICTFISLFVVLFNKEIILTLLHLPPYLYAEAQFLLIVTVLAFSIRMIAIPYQAVLEGYQELSLSQLVFTLWILTYSVAVAVALALQPDIYGLGIASLISNFVILGGFFGLARRRFQFLRLDYAHLRSELFGSMLKYGAGIQLATVAIALREPLYKLVLVRAYDLSTVAAFEIAFKLCTQLASIITTPLLGVLGVSALLSQKHDELARILRPLFIYGLIALIPATLFAYTFSVPLFSAWLGEKGSAAANLFPGFFLGFALYYSTEVLYKSIEGSGRSWYSALLQLSILGLQICLLISLTISPWSVVESLIIGFATFSAANLVMFHRCYRTIPLVRPAQALAVIVPSGMFLGLLPFITQDLRIPLFLLYLMLHLITLKYLGFVDSRAIVGLIGKMRRP